MMSNNIPLKQARKDHENNQTSGGGGGGRKTSSQRPPEQTLRCPRCDSTNTKFCYYNNYNLTQPRYFCKTCRRYWTKGGALRNIPIGGGCRKNKKTKACSSKFIIGDSSSGNGVSPPLMGFHLGGMNYPHRVNHFSSSSSLNTNSQTNLPFMNLESLGFSYNPKLGDHHHHDNQTADDDHVLANLQEMGLTYTNLHHHQTSSLTSSIQTLSSLNQDLHWKLQQQRLAMLFGGDHETNHHHDRQHQKESGLQPILFQNLETSRKEASGSRSGGGGVGGGLATEWFFDNHYAPVNMNPTSTGNDENGVDNINNWNGIQDWNNMNHYNPLP